MDPLLLLVSSMLISVALIPPLIRIAPRIGLVDRPDPRKVHQRTMPRLGGIAIVCGALIPLFATFASNYALLSILFAALILALAGAWDDRSDLDYKIKFALQIGAAVIIIHWGGTEITRLPFFDQTPLPGWVSKPLTLFVLLASTNAVNLSDGLDGLAGGMAILAFGVVAILAIESGQPTELLMAMAVIGGIGGFLRYNNYPAQLFMGDAGSQFIGLCLGVVVIQLTFGDATPYCPALALFLLGLPLLDTGQVMLRRISQGRSPFHADRQHLHHRLLDTGLDHYEVVTLMYIGQGVMVFTGFLVRYQHDLINLLIYTTTGLALIATVRLPGMVAIRQRLITIKPVELVRNHSLSGWIRRVLLLILGSYFIFIPIFTRDGTVELLAVAIIGTLLLFGSCFWTNHDWIGRLAIYLCGSAVVYLAQRSAPPGTLFPAIDSAFYAVVVMLVLAGLRYTRQKEFELSPFDFLIISCALAVPMIAGPLFGNPKLGQAIANLVVIYYAVEFVITSARSKRVLLGWAALSFIALATQQLAV